MDDEHSPLGVPAAPAVERLIRPLRSFLAQESAGGALLVVATVVALVWANSPWSHSYEQLWSTDLSVTFGSHTFGMNLHHWVNDGLMAIFFFVVGLEIKRELVQGELRDRRTAALPAVAALGGMVVPALLFAAITLGDSRSGGWGIPMATDIAMAVGVLALAGRRFVPPALSLFLLALAIVDDIGAIVVIAVFYSDGISPWWLAGAIGCGLGVLVLNRARIVWMPAYVALGTFMWFCTFESGVHATLAGVALGLLAPTTPVLSSDEVAEDEILDLSTPRAARATALAARHSVSVVEWLEQLLHPWSSFVVVPIFALANAGIPISAETVSDAMSSRVVWGIIVGLVVGKPLGISLASWLAMRAGVAQLPVGVRFTQIMAAGVVAGIGFTVSLFVGELAYDRGVVLDEAKLAVLAASLVAGVAGLIAVRAAGRRHASPPPTPTPTATTPPVL